MAIQLWRPVWIPYCAHPNTSWADRFIRLSCVFEVRAAVDSDGLSACPVKTRVHDQYSMRVHGGQMVTEHTIGLASIHNRLSSISTQLQPRFVLAVLMPDASCQFTAACLVRQRLDTPLAGLLSSCRRTIHGHFAAICLDDNQCRQTLL